VTMPSAQENTAKPIKPDTRIPKPAPWDLLLGGVRAAGPALAPAQLSLAERCFRHLGSCIVGCRMIHVLTRGGPKSQDSLSFGPPPIRKHATPQISEFVSDPPHE
jgi:hypothetical protein